MTKECELCKPEYFKAAAAFSEIPLELITHVHLVSIDNGDLVLDVTAMNPEPIKTVTINGTISLGNDDDA